MVRLCWRGWNLSSMELDTICIWCGVLWRTNVTHFSASHLCVSLCLSKRGRSAGTQGSFTLLVNPRGFDGLVAPIFCVPKSAVLS